MNAADTRALTASMLGLVHTPAAEPKVHHPDPGDIWEINTSGRRVVVRSVREYANCAYVDARGVLCKGTGVVFTVAFLRKHARWVGRIPGRRSGIDTNQWTPTA
jgi:hypothetical protein